MCAREYEDIVMGDMKWETFEKIQELLSYNIVLFLHCSGEPLINPRFMDIFLTAKKYGSLVGFTTNGTFFNTGNVDLLVRHGLNFLNFSIESTVPEKFSEIRRGASLDQVLKGIELFVETKRRLRKSNPILGISFTTMQRNVGELPQVIRLAKEHNLQAVSAKNVTYSDNIQDRRFFEQETLARIPEHAYRIGQEAQSLARELGIILRLSKEFTAYENDSKTGNKDSRKALICSEPWETIFIGFDGTVRPCCVSNHIMGDLNHQTIEEIWNGQEYQRYRDCFRQNRRPKNCNFCETTWFENRSRTYFSFLSKLGSQFVKGKILSR